MKLFIFIFLTTFLFTASAKGQDCVNDCLAQGWMEDNCTRLCTVSNNLNIGQNSSQGTGQNVEKMPNSQQIEAIRKMFTDAAEEAKKNMGKEDREIVECGETKCGQHQGNIFKMLECYSDCNQEIMNKYPDYFKQRQEMIKDSQDKIKINNGKRGQQ